MRIGLLSEVPQPRLIDSDMDKIVTSSLVDSPRAPTWPSLRIYRHFPCHTEATTEDEDERSPREFKNMRKDGK